MSLQWTSFRKTMVKSSLSPRFRLGLPKEFCEAHLPGHDHTLILVDESDREYDVIYSKRRNCQLRSSGWRDFAVEHGLQEGDTVVFYLIGECRFKVHIIRSSKSMESEIQNSEAVDPVILEDLTEEKATIGNTATQKKLPVSCAVESHQENMLCRIEKRRHEEVVPKGKKHLKVALSPHHMNFCKIMHRSHLSKGRLRLPTEFCKARLPRHNTTIILEDKDRREYNVEYLEKENILCGGWRFFARANGLLEGDALVFQLIDPCKFKVHITRASRAITTVFMNNKPVDFVKREDLIEENAYISYTATQKKHPVLRSVDYHQVYVRRKHMSTATTGASHIHSAAPLGFGNSESVFNLKGFDDFEICFNGERLDSEIPEHIRTKYFELCCVENRSLHDHVKEDLSSKLVVSMILDIVSIAESTKATSISTNLHHLKSMDKTLKYFEDSGMTVRSLRAKIDKLIKILNEHHSVVESTIVRLEALECEREAFMEKKKKIDELIASAMDHGKMIGDLEENIDGSKEKMDKLSLMLKEIAGLKQ